MPVKSFKTLFLCLLVAVSSSTAQNYQVLEEFNLSCSLSSKGELSESELEHLSAMKIGLALSGGGARGIAQIGVLSCLEENNIPVDMIAGVSMGSVIAGFYAAGYSASEIENFVLSQDWETIFQDEPQRTNLFVTQRQEQEKFILNLRLQGLKPHLPTGLTSGQKISNLISNYLSPANLKANSDFDNLKIPLRIVTTDLYSGKEIVLKEGDLGNAIRASIGVPLLFPPLKVDSLYLVDGGLTSPIPVNVIKDEGCDYIIAVNTSADLILPEELNSPLEIADQTTTIMMREETKDELASANIIIAPELEGHKSNHFDDIPSLIEKGKNACDQVIDRIKHDIENESSIKKHRRFVIDSIIFAAGGPMCELKCRKQNYCMREDIIDDLQNLYETGFYSQLKLTIFQNNDTLNLQYNLRFNHDFDSLTITGNTLFDLDTLEKCFHLERNTPISLVEVENGIDKIIDKYNKTGHILAQVDSLRIEEGRVSFRIKEGKIANIWIEGNKHTRNWLIKSYLPFKVGDIYNLNKVRNGIQNLYSTGLFSTVLQDIKGSDDGVILIIRVVENLYWLIRWGVRFDLVSQTESAVEIGDDNFLGIATRLKLYCSYGHREINTHLGYTSDRIWRTYLMNKAGVFFTQEKSDIFKDGEILNSYYDRRLGGEFVIGHQIFRLGTVFAELRTERINLYNDDFEDWVTSHIITFRSIVDDLNKVQFPTSGRYNLTYVAYSQDIFGGHLSYLKVLGSFEYFLTASIFTFHPFVQYGFSTGTLPYFEEFKLADGIGFWGFREDEVRGKNTASAGIDLRLNLPYNLKIYAGSAIGNCMGKLPKLKREELETGWGAGLGMETPAGPIKLWWGKNSTENEYFGLSIGYEY
ncbi:patatin-like phospholipase family protein [bacterium]|nr:patatin-like phospholipase family protein [bacterium]